MKRTLSSFFFPSARSTIFVPGFEPSPTTKPSKNINHESIFLVQNDIKLMLIDCAMYILYEIFINKVFDTDFLKFASSLYVKTSFSWRSEYIGYYTFGVLRFWVWYPNGTASGVLGVSDRTHFLITQSQIDCCVSSGFRIPERHFSKVYFSIWKKYVKKIVKFWSPGGFSRERCECQPPQGQLLKSVTTDFRQIFSSSAVDIFPDQGRLCDFENL